MGSQLIPEEYEYNTVGDPSYTSGDETQKIQERTEVRLRIVGTKMDQTEIVSVSMPPLLLPIHNSICCNMTSPACAAVQFCIGTIKEDFLGVVSTA
jgi:DNA-directed RNA polymerase subunit E'/Rpb7